MERQIVFTTNQLNAEFHLHILEEGGSVIRLNKKMFDLMSDGDDSFIQELKIFYPHARSYGVVHFNKEFQTLNFLKFFRDVQFIEHLTIYSESKITPDLSDLRYLQYFQRLESLQLSFGGQDEFNFNQLRHIGSIKTLRSLRVGISADEIPIKEFCFIGQLTNLESLSLNLDYTEVDDYEGLKVISKLQYLRKLKIFSVSKKFPKDLLKFLELHRLEVVFLFNNFVQIEYPENALDY